MTNPWAWQDRNPYYATAFQILDLDPTAAPAVVRARIAARRKRITYDATRFPLFGEVLDVARINAAEEQLGTPSARLRAELITHRPVPSDADLGDGLELLELARTLASGAAAADDATSPPANESPCVPPLRYDLLLELMPTTLGSELEYLRGQRGTTP
ncbi:hypothetical protein [Nocardia sp. NPDC127526]|uniref:hypothetical protein n=1 Tax=Nocardia sp. NPDC127526 TaxID=3345393 RepID=UPI003634ECB0